MQGLEEDYERVSGMKLTAAEIAVAAEASDIVARISFRCSKTGSAGRPPR